MSNSEEQYYLINKHLDQTMTDEEQHLFDTLMEESADFRKELEQVQVLVAGVKAVEKAEAIARIKEAFVAFDQERSPTRKLTGRKLWPLGIAASLLLMAFLAYFLLSETKPISPLAVYESYYEIFPADAETRSGKGSLEALRYYEQGQYDAAIPLLEELSEDSGNALIPVYLANAYLQINNPHQAIQALENRISSTDSTYSSQFFQWYLGLAWLKAGDQQQALVFFGQLAKKEGVYQKKSQEIIDKLR